jgi:hypothetical protein
MQRINFEKMKVEHWCSLSDCPEDRSLDYSNLLAVCQGKFPGVEHCDTCKKEQLMDISPLQKIHIDQIYYGKASGEIFSDNQNHQKEINALLNLNIQPLKDNRKKALSVFRKELVKKYPGKTANYQKELDNLLALPKEKRPPFYGIILWYLKEKLK